MRASSLCYRLLGRDGAYASSNIHNFFLFVSRYFFYIIRTAFELESLEFLELGNLISRCWINLRLAFEFEYRFLTRPQKHGSYYLFTLQGLLQVTSDSTRVGLPRGRIEEGDYLTYLFRTFWSPSKTSLLLPHSGWSLLASCKQKTHVQRC